MAASLWQICREATPTTVQESDEFLRYRLGEFCEIIDEVGPDKFQLAIRRCLRIYSKRWELTTANIRREAGLDCSPSVSPAVEAWEMVTTIVRNHVSRNADGHVSLESKVMIRDGVVTVIPVPQVSDSIRRAVDLLGGWGAMREAWPQWWNQRFTQFMAIFKDNTK